MWNELSSSNNGFTSILSTLLALPFFFLSFSSVFSEQPLVPMEACSGRVRDLLQRFGVYFSVHRQFKIWTFSACYAEDLGLFIFLVVFY